MTGTVYRTDIVAAAVSWIGTPYRHQASLKGVGCDCLGLVRGVWRTVVGPEPEVPVPYTPDWAEAGGHESLAEAAARYLVEVPLGERREGDVILFRWRPHLPAKHAAILARPDRIIHAYERACVVETALSTAWIKRAAGAYRFPGVID